MSETNGKQAQKFRDMAGKLDQEIAHMRRVRTEPPTRKRLQEEASQRQQADRLEQVAFALRSLADGSEAGTTPPILAKVRTKSDVETLVTYKSFPSWNGGLLLAKAGIHAENYDEARSALLALANAPDRAAENALVELERRARSLIGTIPGFFPTPAEIGGKMCDYSDAGADAGQVILEPSAGSGALLSVIANRFPGNRLVACEANMTLRDLLARKGVDLVGDDFLEYRGEVDHVIMNPPFEGGADAAHVMHAWSLLRPGGSLVAIMSNSVTFRTDGKYKQFAAWRDGLANCHMEPLPEGAFRSSGTTVNAVMFCAYKEGGA